MERPVREEKLNAWTHGIGLILSIAGSFFLMRRASGLPDATLWWTCGLYSVALIGVFFGSMMSHLCRDSYQRSRYRVLDQAMIYILIVATLTPLGLLYLQTPWWRFVLAAMWFVAVTGFLSKLFWAHRVDRVSVLGYVILGWMPLLGIPEGFAGIPSGAIIGTLVGGTIYTLGTLFLLLDKKVWYFHAIWHLFVISAAAVHWLTTWRYMDVHNLP